MAIQQVIVPYTRFNIDKRLDLISVQTVQWFHVYVFPTREPVKSLVGVAYLMEDLGSGYTPIRLSRDLISQVPTYLALPGLAKTKISCILNSWANDGSVYVYWENGL